MQPQHLLGTTRGRILALLCRGRATVTELAAHLHVTDNAVRAQLQRLERDALVVQAGSRAGVRRPHVEYELSPEALNLFPTAYEPVLSNLVQVLADRLQPKLLRQLLLDAGRRLLQQHFGELRGRNPRQRISEIMNKLNGSSFGIDVLEESGRTVVRSCACPVAHVTAAHPEICGLFATVIGETISATVRESCEKGDSPRCCFELMHNQA